MIFFIGREARSGFHNRPFNFLSSSKSNLRLFTPGRHIERQELILIKNTSTLLVTLISNEHKTVRYGGNLRFLYISDLLTIIFMLFKTSSISFQVETFSYPNEIAF